MDKLCDITYDLQSVPVQEFVRKPPAGLNPAYYIASLRLSMKMAPELLQINLRLGERVLFERIVPQPRPRSLSEGHDN